HILLCRIPCTHRHTSSPLHPLFRWLLFSTQTLSRTTKMEPSTGPCRAQWCADHLIQPPPRRAVTVQAECAGIWKWCRPWIQDDFPEVQSTIQQARGTMGSESGKGRKKGNCK
ncbi:hypothetical protein PpBr36_07446, partial [Pyricularia pennisetigena]|uniref:hypothetical protein n=1 Tax=Pyricularia pennisetigena TaxID=1578925 RepID=UPI001150BA3B